VPPSWQPGLGYAQGGARVSTNITQNYAAVLALPVAAQVGQYLGAYGRFDPAQVILIQGGGNDVINNVLGAYQGAIDPGAVPALVSRAAADLADVVNRIVLAGGEKIVLVNVPDIGSTPLAAGDADLSQDLSAMSALFNQVLLRQVNLASNPRRARPLVMVDASGWTNERIADYKRYGFTVGNQGVACSTPKIVSKALSIGLVNPQLFIRQNGTALLCANDTLTEAGADQNFMFADDLHPSSRMHALFAGFVLQRMASEGL
jgi:phospholipase/lecithinase/hemolysin